MSDGSLRVLTLISALGCGLAEGIFFAFSAFVMKALDRLPLFSQPINVPPKPRD